MITLDALRAALLAEKPWSALDLLVRTEQTAGRRVKDIHDELQALVEPARDAGPLSDPADDAMMDTLDALSGNCAPRWRYTDTPDESLPPDAAVAALPLRARVALAARCSRRVLPLFRHNWTDAEPDRLTWLGWAVAEVERSAAAPADAGRVAPAAALAIAAYVCDAVYNARRDRRRAVEVIAAIPLAVERLVAVEDHAADAAVPVVVRNTPVTIADALAVSRISYDQLYAAGVAAVRDDFGRLAHGAQAGRWTDDSPVPPEVFGPLWPYGPPAGWPAGDPGPEPVRDLPAFRTPTDRAAYVA